MELASCRDAHIADHPHVMSLLLLLHVPWHV
jgi:hypothetical protein